MALNENRVYNVDHDHENWPIYFFGEDNPNCSFFVASDFMSGRRDIVSVAEIDSKIEQQMTRI